jgi:lactosylceramide 4-alpha-galactosyltransferase
MVELKTRGRKEALFLVWIFCVIFFVLRMPYYEFATSNPYRKNSLCIDSMFLTSPIADGLTMKVNLPPSQWIPFNATSNNRRIFFHETSGLAKLNLQQCCVVESAAKHNPDRPVQLFLRPIATSCSNGGEPSRRPSTSFYRPPWLDVLSRYPNVAAILVNEDHYFAGTPLQDWYEKGEWLKSPHEIAHLSDYIRVLTLYKGGGLYLDTDILTLKGYEGDMFSNCLVYGSGRKEVFSNGVMHLERGHWLSAEIIRLLAEEYDPDAYAYHGPALVSEVMGRKCGVVAGYSNSNNCNDVRLLSDRFFYPIEAPFSDVIFRDNGNKTDVEALIKIRKSYGLHLWNSLSYVHQPARTDSNQIFSVLARQHCPLTVARAADFQTT